MTMRWCIGIGAPIYPFVLSATNPGPPGSAAGYTGLDRETLNVNDNKHTETALYAGGAQGVGGRQG
jgi:hypothetical protein